MEHPKDIGDRTVLAVMLAMQATGHAVLVPFGENTRYDLVIERHDTLARVQCKTGRLRRGAICFAPTSCYGHHRSPASPRRGYQGQIDYFAVYCPETAGVYLVPIEDVLTRSSAALRVAPPRNGQVKGIRRADHYKIAKISITRD